MVEEQMEAMDRIYEAEEVEEHIKRMAITVQFTGWQQPADSTTHVGRLITDPPFIVTFPSGRQEDFRCFAMATVPFSMRVQAKTRPELERMYNSRLKQAMFSLNIVLQEIVDLGRKGFILRHSKKGRPRGRPIADFGLIDRPSIITARPPLPQSL